MIDHQFTPEHYRVLLQSGLENGYSFLLFGESLAERSVYVRHDVDNSIDDALAMARIEASHGVRSTYLVLLRSRNYNLLAGDCISKVRQIASLGHEIGLHHSCEPEDAPDTGLTLEQAIKADALLLQNQIDLPIKVFCLHNPAENDNFDLDVPGLINTYEDRYFRRIKYMSESNFHWRDGCPCETFARRSHDALQVLVHPMSYASTLSNDRDALLYFLTEKIVELSTINHRQNRVLRADPVSLSDIANSLSSRAANE